MAFEGFADTRRTFFRKLAKNQNREWFQEHKDEYVEGWHKPMQELLAAVRAKVDEDFPYCELAEPKVFRLQRDTRFSKDKTPYKTRIAGVIFARGRGNASVTEVPAALYISIGIGGEELTGHGQYAMTPSQLTKFRAALLDSKRGAEVARIATKLTKAGFLLTAAETLKKVPRGIDPHHPRADLLMQKGLVAVAEAVPPELLTSPKLVNHLAKQTRKAADLVTWLVETVT
jgi:uncharacterized protein (TIGR02453 family)